jgi:hypothetical protein
MSSLQLLPGSQSGLQRLKQLMTIFALACSVRGSGVGDPKAGMVGWILSRPCNMFCFLHLCKVATYFGSCKLKSCQGFKGSRVVVQDLGAVQVASSCKLMVTDCQSL